MVHFQSEESIFNIAVAYLKRIDTLLYMCQQAAISENIEAWYKYLRAVFREASVKIKDKEEEEIVGTTKDKINLDTLLDKNVEEKEATFMNLNILMNNIQVKQKHKRTILFLLDALEIKIRRKLQEKGMLLPSKADVRSAIFEK